MPDRTQQKLPTSAAAAIVLVSGFAALTLEVLWARRLALVFGGTVFAATAVLCAYTLGAAFGAAVLGPLADRVRRPLKFVGLILLWLGVLGYAAHEALIPLAGRLNAALFGTGPVHLWARSAVRFGWSLLALALPSLAIGGTLPAMARCVAPGGQAAGRRVGLVWAAITAGAVGGVLLTGFVLIGRLGVPKALLIGTVPPVVLGLILMAGGVTFGRAGVSQSAIRNPPSAMAGTSRRRGLGIVVFLAGAAMLALEVLYLRTMVFFVGGATYTFTLVVATFLGGLALGAVISSAWVERWGRRGGGWSSLAWLLGLAGAAAAGSVYVVKALLVRSAGGLGSPPEGTWAGNVGWAVTAAAGVMGLPAVLCGMAMPILIRLATGVAAPAASGSSARGSRSAGGKSGIEAGAGEGGAVCVGRRVGWVSAVYNVGAAGGAATALWLAPLLGVQRALVAVAAVLVAIGAITLVKSFLARGGGRLRYAAVVAVLGGAALCGVTGGGDGLFWPAVEAQVPGAARAFYEEGPDALVSVLTHNERNVRALLINRHIQGDDTELGTIVQWRQGFIPMLLGPAPRRACVIGLGTGATAFAASVLTESPVDVAEMSPGVVRALSFFPGGLNGALDEDPRVRIRVEDGRAFLGLSHSRYDVIIVDIIYPSVAGAGNLFSVDFYRRCLERLSAGGVLCHWVPAWQMMPEAVDSAAWAFSLAAGTEATVSLWCAVPSARQPVLGFVAVKAGGPALTVADLRRRVSDERAGAMLALAGIRSPEDVLAHCVREGLLLPATDRARANSDAHPVIEFLVPRQAAGEAGPLNLARAADGLGPVQVAVADSADTAWAQALARRREAVSVVLAGQLRAAAFAPAPEAALAAARAELAAYATARDLGWADPVVALFERQARYAELVARADLARNDRRTEEAIDLARSAIQLAPTEAEAYGLLAECLVDAGRPGEAAEMANRAFTLDAANLRYLLTVAMARYNEGKVEIALGEADDLLERDPDNLDARRLRATALRRLGRQADAEREERAIRRLERRGRG